MNRWVKRGMAGCVGALLGAATVIGVGVHWLNASMARDEARKTEYLAEELAEGRITQQMFDRFCNAKLDPKRRGVCVGMQAFLAGAAKPGDSMPPRALRGSTAPN